MAVSLLLVFGD